MQGQYVLTKILIWDTHGGVAAVGARSTFIIHIAPRRPMSSKGWWIGMAVAAAVVYYGTSSFLPFK